MLDLWLFSGGSEAKITTADSECSKNGHSARKACRGSDRSTKAACEKWSLLRRYVIYEIPGGPAGPFTASDGPALRLGKELRIRNVKTRDS